MSWISEAAHSQPAATVMAGLVTLFIGVLTSAATLFIGWRQSSAAITAATAAKDSSRAALLAAQSTGDRSVATMRLQWVTDLRKTISEYHSILMTAKTLEPRARQRLSELGTQLDLLLNVENDAQKELWTILDKIIKTDEIEDRRQFDEPLMRAEGDGATANRTGKPWRQGQRPIARHL